GVGCVEHIRNPIRAARKVLTESPHVYFVGTGAERFAQEHGIELCSNDDLIIEREVVRLREAKKQSYLEMPDEFGPMRSRDTVGAVALDCDGNIAAATSTGGTLNKAPGRVGESSSWMPEEELAWRIIRLVWRGLGLRKTAFPRAPKSGPRVPNGCSLHLLVFESDFPCWKHLRKDYA